MLFHQNLRDQAEKWFSTLPSDIRGDWSQLRKVFLDQYCLLETLDAACSVLVSQRVSILKQGPNKPIVKYLDHYNDLEVEADAIITQTMGTQMA